MIIFAGIRTYDKLCFQEEQAMQPVENFPAPDLIGTFKTFGPFGPAYQVV